MKTYSEKLKDPRWQRKRLEVMERDGFACADCGDKEAMLSVHHRYYITGRNPWEYPNWSLKTLCPMCHEEMHYMEEGRLNGNPVPKEDNFELIMGFVTGNGCDVSESYFWDIAAQIGMASENLGRTNVLSNVLKFVTTLKESSIPKSNLTQEAGF